jgi:hypothetical protein
VEVRTSVAPSAAARAATQGMEVKAWGAAAGSARAGGGGCHASAAAAAAATAATAAIAVIASLLDDAAAVCIAAAWRMPAVARAAPRRSIAGRRRWGR